MEIIHVTAESLPLCKTGGLADVVYSLAKEQVKQKNNVTIFLPEYGLISQNQNYQLKHLVSFEVYGKYVGVNELIIGDIKFYLIDNKEYFGSDQLYSYSGDTERFGYFNWAVVEAVNQLNLQPDIIHLHDWHPGLIPFILKTNYQDLLKLKVIKTMLTIHNLRYQGIVSLEKREEYHLKESSDYVLDNNINFLKSAIQTADALSTVSPSYRQEVLKDRSYGYIIDILQMREKDFYGILNGIDQDFFNPQTDKNLAKNYSQDNFTEGKKANKEFLSKEFQLEIKLNQPLYIVISRFAEQKGLDLLNDKLEEFLKNDVFFFMLGSGEQKYENYYARLSEKYNNFKVYLGYNEDLAHLLYASGDFLIMPSHFEPCGLSQIIAMQYGCIPIVRAVGGLKDTVRNYDSERGSGTGIVFANYESSALYAALNFSQELYKMKHDFLKIRENALKENFSWKKAAETYQNIYQKLFN